MRGDSGYVPRLIDETVQELSLQLPALLITGPRASGKTTTAQRHVATVVHLDQELERARRRPRSALQITDPSGTQVRPLPQLFLRQVGLSS